MQNRHHQRCGYRGGPGHAVGWRWRDTPAMENQTAVSMVAGPFSHRRTRSGLNKDLDELTGMHLCSAANRAANRRP
jgi:hypothetical protein